MIQLYPTLIIFAPTDDDHVRAVLPLIDSKTLVYVCDLSQFGSAFAGSLNPLDPLSISLQDSNGNEISFRNLETIWWRRILPFAGQENLEPSVNEFLTEEKIQFWSGLLALLPGKIRWYNHFQKDLAASRKIYQLKAAAECELQLPETIVTSVPSEARNFLTDHPKVICKEFHGTREH